MKDFKDRVAVVTGAASGLGRAFAIHCAEREMKLVLADIDASGIEETISFLPEGTEAISLRCDVRDPQSVEEVAKRTYASFGACHLLFNNAGVCPMGPIWSATPDEWEWGFGVNVIGVANGVRSFVPRMVLQGSAAHIVNTASAAGFLASPGWSVYCATKHAVVALSECLHHELSSEGAAISVSILCPAVVETGIAYSDRNRPAELAATNPATETFRSRLIQTRASLTANDIARVTLEAVEEGRFYILPHETVMPRIASRMQDILSKPNPTPIAG